MHRRRRIEVPHVHHIRAKRPERQLESGVLDTIRVDPNLIVCLGEIEL